VDASRLALELAERMREVVPEDITILVDGDVLWFGSLSGPGRAGSHACRWLHKGPGADEDLLVEACRLALDDLQDFVDEATTEPWPRSGRAKVPPAGASVEGNQVLLWYGDRDDPVLRLGPLPIEQ
jgi:hypothetical protein